MSNAKKGFISLLFFLFFILVLFLVPYTRAFIIMSLLSQSEMNKTESEIQIHIPVNEMNWFPKMIWYDASDEFNRVHGTHLTLKVLYTYGGFEGGTSTIFDEKSPYYSSFYGAYLIEDPIYPQSLEEISEIPIYDYENLILRDLGDPNYKGAFKYNIKETQEGVSYLGTDDWQKIDIDIETHGLWHQQKGFINHYIQFGIPKSSENMMNFADFKVIKLNGRLYCKRVGLEKTIVLYILTPSRELLEQTDNKLLSKSIISVNE